MVSDCSACMALYSPLNSLTPIKASLQRIKLQHKVDTEKDLLYDLLFHVCHCADSQTIWQVNSGTGLLLLFHQVLLVSMRVLWLNSLLSSKRG